MQETSNTAHHRLILGVNGDGYFYWEIAMKDTSTYPFDTAYIWRETTTTLKVAKGWNYIAMHFDEIYDYAYIRMYHRTEFHTGAKLFDIYEAYSKGVREFTNDDTLVLGCMTYLGLGPTGGSSASSSYWSTQPTDVLYGLCMKGWINTIEVYRSGIVNYDTKFDALFNAD